MGYRDDRLDRESSNSGWYYCKQCGKAIRKSEIDVDHIYPKSKGGVDHHLNTQILCQSCNRSKRDSVDSRVAQGYANKIGSLFKK